MKQYGAGSSRGKIPRAPCGQSCTKTVIIHSFIHSFTKCLQRPPRICQPGRRDTTSLRQAWVLSSPPAPVRSSGGTGRTWGSEGGNSDVAKETGS